MAGYLRLRLVSQTAGAITTEIPAGTVVNGGDVHTIVTQKVYGEANNFTVSGHSAGNERRKNVRQRHLSLRATGCYERRRVL